MLYMNSAINLSNLPIDPNEPLYCYCQQVSFGEMVACDNEDVRPPSSFILECTVFGVALTDKYIYIVRDRVVSSGMRWPAHSSKRKMVL